MTFLNRALATMLAGVLLTLGVVANAALERSDDGVWQDVDVSRIATRGTVYIRPNHYRAVALDDARVAAILARAPAHTNGGPGVVLTLPMPHGGFERFEIYDAPIMAAELAEKFPQIRTYAGHGLDDKTARVRLDRTPAGFHGMIRSARGTAYIDPYQLLDGQAVGSEYLSYHKSDVTLTGDRQYKCDVHKAGHDEPKASPAEATRTPIGPVLRTYRLAVATTGEYAQFHGGTVANAQAAIVTAINRVTGLYQEQLGIALELIPNNDLLINLNSVTDGYTNNNGFAMLAQNQSRVDSVIGSGNYDIGHVFSTGGGGIARLGSVCRGGLKAQGVTGLPQPIGDPFYVDFVSHEIGHQYGANHTFNGTANACASPNRNASTAYEPGSGSTIMAYAGICGSHNIANSSDDHFHTESFDEIVDYTNFGSGSNCSANTNTGNQAPLVDAGASFTVPVNTPLRLTGAGTDPDGDTLVYRWEQYDLGPGGSPATPSGNAPIFRSFSAVSEPVRYLPKLNDILNNGLTVGERLPTYARNLRFRLTALDMQTGGGGVDFDTVQHSVTDQAGPFDITSQNSTTTWTPGTLETITWDVANTNLAPVNCGNVNILFSADLGQTFSTLLAIFTANDGSETITVPNIQTSVGRIIVECADNIFLDINNVNITILDQPDPDFQINVADETLQVCAPDDGVLDVDVLSLGGFTGPVSLATSGTPAGVTSTFSSNPVNAGNASTLTLGGTGAAAQDSYTVTVSGTGSTGTRSDDFTFNLLAGPAQMPTMLVPTDGERNVPILPILSWAPATGATDYLVEISTDSGFGNIVYSATEPTTSHAVTASLQFGTDYFWRVSAQNFCGASASTTATFRTVNGPFVECAFPFAVIPDDGGPIESSLNVGIDGTVLDINVTVEATHGASGHLGFGLRSDITGTTVQLMDQPGAPLFTGGCPTANVQNLYDDESGIDAEDVCNVSPPGIGPDSRPDEPLSTFDSEAMNGQWTLTAFDGEAGTTGSLDFWCIEIVYDETVFVDTDGDGVGDDQDNCTLIDNADQLDTNGDGFGNICDADLNNDLTVNAVDLGIFRSRFFSSDLDADFNGDGTVNVQDLGILRQAFFNPPGPSGIAP
ncbi:MAG: reprolysin-like metallopeptidase [Gammaproteobacteria bacterium]